MPRGARIGRNVKVAADVRTSDFPGRTIRSGESVEAGAGKRGGRKARPTALPSIDGGKVALVGGARGKHVLIED